MLLILLAACTPLVGDWSGQVDCGDTQGDLDISLDWVNGRYEGDGTLDCTEAAFGYACEETFDVQIDGVGAFGQQDLSVDLDQCEFQIASGSYDQGCDNPDHTEWDGATTITGNWATSSGSCDFELERNN